MIFFFSQIDKPEDQLFERTQETLSQIFSALQIISSRLELSVEKLREKHTRLGLFGEKELRRMLILSYQPRELINNIEKLFEIKEFTFNGQNILGWITRLGESCNFIKDLEIDIDQNLAFNLIGIIEEATKKALQQFFFKGLGLFARNWRDFGGNNKANLQTLLLLIDICFYHDLFAIVGALEYVTLDMTENLMKFRKTLQNCLNNFVNGNKKTNPHVAKQIMLKVLHYMDILSVLIVAKVESVYSFEFLSLPKFSLEIIKSSNNNESIYKKFKIKIRNILHTQDEQIPNLTHDSELLSSFTSQENCSVVLMAMNQRIKLGWEIKDPNEMNFLMMAYTDKKMCHIMQAINNRTGVILTGANAIGKKSTLKVIIESNIINIFLFQELALLLSVPLFFVAPMQNFINQKALSNYVKSCCSGGYWLCFKNIEITNSAWLSLISETVSKIYLTKILILFYSHRLFKSKNHSQKTLLLLSRSSSLFLICLHLFLPSFLLPSPRSGL